MRKQIVAERPGEINDAILDGLCAGLTAPRSSAFSRRPTQSPAAGSKLPRFLQSLFDRSESLFVDSPAPSASSRHNEYQQLYEPICDLPSLPPPLCWPGVAGVPPSHSLQLLSAIAIEFRTQVPVRYLRPHSIHQEKWWPLGGTKDRTSHVGWRYMLRTNQSPLVRALERVGVNHGTTQRPRADAGAEPSPINTMNIAMPNRSRILRFKLRRATGITFAYTPVAPNDCVSTPLLRGCINPSQLDSLFSFSHLVLSAPARFNLDDAVFAEMARARPHLATSASFSGCTLSASWPTMCMEFAIDS
ncbi:hypothetical protein K438DRAFT_2016163 [Mycena galopus ATCC 62051]|nr:hypothetical protein K438DRAFT_2016163 [Mycena galopus ATCC 62051]